MSSTASLPLPITRPFKVINNNPLDVRAKYLAAVPYGTSGSFPGPFNQLTNQEKIDYINTQQKAQEAYPDLATYPVDILKDSPYNVNDNVNCQQYGYPPEKNEVPMVPSLETENGYPNNNFDIFQDRYSSADEIYDQPFFKPTRNKDNVEDFKDVSFSDPQSRTGFGSVIPELNTNTSTECSGYPSFNDNPLLDLKNRPVSQASHANMLPFGAKFTQNMFSTGVPQAFSKGCDDGSELKTGYAGETPFRQKLDLFSGCPEMYLHKREVGPMFSPAEQQTSWVHGTPLFRPDLNRLEQSVKYRNNESPVEKQHIGPGIGLDYSTPAQGGYQQFTRVLPNNVNAYRRNQLPGRVKSGKWFTNHPTSQFTEGLQTNRPKSYIPQSRRPTMRSKFTTNAMSPNTSGMTEFYTSVNRGKQARADTGPGGGFGPIKLKKTKAGEKIGTTPKNDEQEYCIEFGEAPVGLRMGSHVPLPPNNLSTYKDIRETFKRGAAGWDSRKGGYWQCLDQEQGSFRWDLLPNGKGIVPQWLGAHDGVYANLTNRGDQNPYVINVSGTVNGGLWNPNSAQDIPRVTRKETTQFSYLGAPNSNVKGQTQMTTDLPPVTRKETTQFSYSGNIQSPNNHIKLAEEQPPDVTRKETTLFSYHGMPGGNAQPINRFMYEGDTMPKVQ